MLRKQKGNKKKERITEHDGTGDGIRKVFVSYPDWRLSTQIDDTVVCFIQCNVANQLFFCLID